MALCNTGAISALLGDYAEARTSLDASLAVSRKIGHRYAEGQGLLYLGMLSLQLGDLEQACEQSQCAEQIAGQIGDAATQATALLNLGHAQAAQERYTVAAGTYHRALELLKDAGEPALSAEAQAGLAELTLAEGDLPRAVGLVEEVLPSLENEALTQTGEPFRIYLACYHVLQAAGDPRARQVLEAGYRLLQERAARIGDENARRTFLEVVPVRRKIVEAWESA